MKFVIDLSNLGSEHYRPAGGFIKKSSVAGPARPIVSGDEDLRGTAEAPHAAVTALPEEK